ncbi:MAG: response regulator [SAR202 cluster bacterium]|nr:response regulator [SAR202 cluster bacterium]
MARETLQSTVLVVEGDKNLARLVSRILREAGFSVQQAETGADALVAIDGGAVDAVVLDLGLPDGMGGAVLSRLRELRAAVDGSYKPVWVSTSARDIGEIRRLYGNPGPLFIPKPFDPWNLAGLLRKTIAERRKQAENPES